MRQPTMANNAILGRLPWGAKIVGTVYLLEASVLLLLRLIVLMFVPSTIGWLLVQHLTWSIWIVLAFQRETRSFALYPVARGAGA